MNDLEFNLIAFAVTLAALAFGLGIVTGYVIFRIWSERRSSLMAEWCQVLTWQRDQALKRESRRRAS